MFLVLRTSYNPFSSGEWIPRSVWNGRGSDAAGAVASIVFNSLHRSASAASWPAVQFAERMASEEYKTGFEKSFGPPASEDRRTWTAW